MHYKVRHFIALSVLPTLLLTGCFDSGDDNGPDDIVSPPTLSVTTDTGWSTITRASIVNDVVYTGSKYIAVGDGGYIAESTDGLTWAKLDSGTTASLHKLVILGTKILILSKFDGTLLSSNNGTTWTVHEVDPDSSECQSQSIIFSDASQFVGMSSNSDLCTSPDGATWTKVNGLLGLNIAHIAYGGGKYVLAGTDGSIYSSSSIDTLNWDSSFLPAGSNFDVRDLIYANDRFVAITASGSSIVYSTDGAANWSKATTETSFNSYEKLSYSSAKGFVAYNTKQASNNSFQYKGQFDEVLTSTDAVTWVKTNAAGTPLNSLANGSNETVAFDFEGGVHRSTDLSTNVSTWVSGSDNKVKGPIVGHAENAGVIYVATSNQYTDESAGPIYNGNVFKSSDNGATWSNVFTSTSTIYDIAHNGSNLVLRDKSSIKTSTDSGANWTTTLNYSQAEVLYSSAKIGSTTYHTGSNGVVLSSTDGINFNIMPHLTEQNMISVASNGTGLVGIAADGALIHFDGTNWTTPALGTTTTLSNIVWNGSVYVAVGAGIFTSADGITWTSQTAAHAHAITSIINNGAVLVVASAGGVATSNNDGVTWVDQSIVTTSTVLYLVFDGTNYTGFSAPSNTGFVTKITSTDAANWTVSNDLISTPTELDSLISTHGPMLYDATNSVFVRHVIDNDQALVSSDGFAWTLSATLPTNDGFSYLNVMEAIDNNPNVNDNSFYAGSAAGSLSFGVAFSSDGANWTLKTDQASNQADVSTSGVYARLSGGAIQTSTDNITWTTATTSGLDDAGRSNGLAYVNGQYVLSVESDYNGFFHPSAIYTSSNATDWTFKADLATDSFHPSHIQFDGTNYLLFAKTSDSNVMVYQSSNLTDFIFYDTGIKDGIVDIKVSSSGYTIIGENSSLSTRSAY